MGTSLGGFGLPGMGSLKETYEADILWGGDDAKGHSLWKSGVVSSTARDDGNSPTTILRPGLILGKITSTGEYAQYANGASDGTETAVAILAEGLNMLDQFGGTGPDRVVRVLVDGPVKASRLFVEGVALVGHTDETATRADLNNKSRFKLDDERG